MILDTPVNQKPMLIQTNDLNSILNAKDLIIIDARSFTEYSQGHIPGAINLDLFAFHWIDTTKDGMDAFHKQSRQIFSFCGINNQKKIVFYDNQSGMLAARGVWLLLYFSHPSVMMLDGGINKWNSENLPLETRSNKPIPVNFDGKINPNLITGFEYIQNNIEKLIIIDSRSKEEFDGTIVRAAQSGHIPHAKNIDYNLNISDDGTFKKNKELQNLYSFPKEREVITYCHGAYRAANTFLALKKLGFEKVKVYLGSWGEWGNKTELPIESC